MNRFTLAMCLIATAACTSGAKDQLSVSGRLTGAATDADAGVTADGGFQVAPGIDLSRARVSVRRLRVEAKAAPDAGTKDGDGEVKIAEGPLLIDVSGDKLAGALENLVTTNIPAGSYDQLKVDVHRVDPPAPKGFEDLVSQRASIILDGTVDGKAFTFVSGLEAELELETTFTVGAGATNITLNLDASKWFVAADGTRLDPNDPANKSAIEGNIRASFRAFQDDDEDGVEDKNDDHGHDAADAGDDHGHDAADAGDDHGHDADAGPGDAGDDHGGHH